MILIRICWSCQFLAQDKLTLPLVVEQLSLAFQRALIAFPLGCAVLILCASHIPRVMTAWLMTACLNAHASVRIYRLVIRSLTRTLNRKSRDDRIAEEQLNYPFFVPADHEPLGQQAYFCALRLAILQLDVTRRAMLVDSKAGAEVSDNIHSSSKMGLNQSSDMP